MYMMTQSKINWADGYIHDNHGNLDCYQKTLINQRFFWPWSISTHISIMACKKLFFLINEVWYFHSVTLSLHFGIWSLDMLWETEFQFSILSKGIKWSSKRKWVLFDWLAIIRIVPGDCIKISKHLFQVSP
jgi:hypothetical protein